jgi:hypothetical protein
MFFILILAVILIYGIRILSTGEVTLTRTRKAEGGLVRVVGLLIVCGVVSQGLFQLRVFEYGGPISFVIMLLVLILSLVLLFSTKEIPA